MQYVYVIESVEKNYIYVGMTNNVGSRLRQYQSGKSKTTKAYTPFRHILTEVYKTRVETREREKYLKSGIGKEWIKREILGRL